MMIFRVCGLGASGGRCNPKGKEREFGMELTCWFVNVDNETYFSLLQLALGYFSKRRKPNEGINTEQYQTQLSPKIIVRVTLG